MVELKQNYDRYRHGNMVRKRHLVKQPARELSRLAREAVPVQAMYGSVFASHGRF